MIINLKYHVASLAAVFFALGIGVLAGAAMAGNDFFLSRQEQLIRDIQAQVSSQQEANRRTTRALTAMEQDSAFQKQFNQVALPILIRDRLQGRTVAIIDLDYQKEHERLAAALRTAGALIQSTTVVNLGVLKDVEVNRRLAFYFGKEPGAAPEKYLPDLARSLASAIAIGRPDNLAQSLRELEIIKATVNTGAPPQDIILIGGSNGRELDYARYFDLIMIKTWKTEGARVFGTEDSMAPVSYVRYYEQAGIATIDDIDTAYGQVALVGAMAGHPGHYGIKQTAESFIPPLL